MPSAWSASGTASSRVTARMQFDEHVLILDCSQERYGRAIQRVHAVIVLGDFENQVSLFWFDGLGGPPVPAPGYWEQDTLAFRRTTMRGQMRHSYALTGESSYTCRLEGSLDGGRIWSTISRGEFIRI